MAHIGNGGAGLGAMGALGGGIIGTDGSEHADRQGQGMLFFESPPNNGQADDYVNTRYPKQI